MGRRSRILLAHNKKTATLLQSLFIDDLPFFRYEIRRVVTLGSRPFPHPAVFSAKEEAQV